MCHSISRPHLFGPVAYPVGIISGADPPFFDLWFITVIPKENDGQVTVTGARLEAMSNFLVVPESHTYIMYSYPLQDDAIHLLKHGVFSDASG